MPKFMKAKTFDVEQLIATGHVENDNEADTLTKRRQALWTEKSRLKDTDPEYQEKLAKIADTIKLVNMQLKQWRNREHNEADVLTKRRQALYVEK